MDMDKITQDRKLGAFVGAAIGDMLGVTYEFTQPDRMPSPPYNIVGGGPFKFDAGHGSDDTDLLLCASDAYSPRGEFSPASAIASMVEWMEHKPADIGNQTLSALRAWAGGSSPSFNEQAQGNGGLMRAIAHSVHSPSGKDAFQNAFADTMLTHPSKEAAYCSGTYAALGKGLIDGGDPEELLGVCYYEPYPNPLSEVASTSGWCIHSMRLALWAVEHRDLGFESALSMVIHTGGDTDTNGAIAGGLLGAVLGLEAIPARWREAIKDTAFLAAVEEMQEQEKEVETSST